MASPPLQRGGPALTGAGQGGEERIPSGSLRRLFMMPQPPPRHECDKQRTAPSDNRRGVRNGGQCSDSDSAGSEHSLFDDVEFDSSPNGDSAAGTAATDWSTSCGMPGCAFSHAPQAVATGASVRARMNAHERAMSSWVRHFNGSHREQQRDFLRVHRLRPWARLMEYCAPCGTLCSKHNIAAHRSGKRHMQRLLDAQRAARASEADAASGRRVQPTSNVEPVLGPDSYQWDLAAGSAGRVALDALSVDTILATQLVTFRKSLKGWSNSFAAALRFVLRNLHAATAQWSELCSTLGHSDPGIAAARSETDAWAKLLQLMPSMLLAPDGCCSRLSRFTQFATGGWVSLLTDTLAFADKLGAQRRKPRDMSHVRRTAAQTMRQPGGIGRVAAAFLNGADSSSPRTEATLAALRLKHPPGPSRADLKASVTRGTALATQSLAALPDSTVSASGVFTRASVKACLLSCNVTSAPGLSGLSVSHLVTVLRKASPDVVNDILDELVWLGKVVFDSPATLPPAFWSFFRAARLTAVGPKARPIACGDTLRRLLCRLYAKSKAADFAALLEPVGQYGVAVPAGVERLGLTAQLIHEAGGVLIAVDGRNAFNAVSRTAMLDRVAEFAPEAYALVSKLYGDESQPALMYGLEGQSAYVRLVSAQGVQQGDPLGPALFALVLLPIMRRFREEFPQLRLPTFLDDLTVASLARGSLQDDLCLARQGYEWLMVELRKVGIEVNTDKTLCLLPQNAVDRLPADGSRDVAEFASQCLGGIKTADDDGMLLAGTPVGSTDFGQRTVMRKLESADADRLLRETAMLDDPQAALALLRLCYHSRAVYLARNARPGVTAAGMQRFDGAVMLTLAAVMQEPDAFEQDGDGRPAVFDSCLEAVRGGLCEANLPVTFSAAQMALVRLPASKGGFGLPAMLTRRHAAFVARTVGALRHVYSALAAGQRQRLSGTFFALPTVRDLRQSVLELRDCGLSVEKLQCLVPPAVVSWATTQNAAATARMRQWLASAVPDDSQQCSQSSLCKAVDKLAADQYVVRLRDSIDQESRLRSLARHLSMGSTGAAAFLSALPSSCRHLTMRPAAYRESMRRWMDIPLPPPGGLCSGPRCDREQTAGHAARCSLTGEQNYRHNPLCDMIADVLSTRLKLKHVKREDNQYCVEAGFPECRLDVTWEQGQMSLPQCDRHGALLAVQNVDRTKNGGLLDVTVVDQTAPGYLHRGAASVAGYAAMKKASGKFDTYQGKFPANYTLIPVALEQSGACCPHTKRFVKAVSEHESCRSGGAYTVSRCINRWRQRISVVLQRSISESVLRSFRRTRPAPGRPAPQPGMYKSVSLLVPPRGASTEIRDVSDDDG